MSYEEVMNLAERRGFFIRAANAYPNTLAGFWDYGPLGLKFKNRYVDLWRRWIVKRDEMVEIETAQIMPKKVFVASGHLANFSDPIVECPNCHSIYRPDKLIEEKTKHAVPEKLTDGKYDELLREYQIKCPNCKSELGATKRFNMMFRVGVGPQEEESYLRPEACQGIFVDIPYLFKTQRIKLPKGFAQVGKAFRNEIAPRQAILRQREFYQADVEVCFNPKKADQPSYESALGEKLNLAMSDVEPTPVVVSEAIAQGTIPNKLIAYYLHAMQTFYVNVGIPIEKIRLRKLADDEKAFYSAAAYDLEVKTSVGWLELVACNYRSDHDLKLHGEVSGTDTTVDDEGEKVLPHIFELSMGVDRSLYTILEEAHRVEEGRTYLALKAAVAPMQCGVFPLVSRDGLPEQARKIQAVLATDFDVIYDEGGSIGRRYARADEAGVPFCMTVDGDTLKDGTVTVRERDSKVQVKVKTEELPAWLRSRLA